MKKNFHIPHTHFKENIIALFDKFFHETADDMKRAIKENNISKVKALLEKGVKPKDGCLHTAIVYSNLDMVKLLVEHGANINEEYQVNPRGSIDTLSMETYFTPLTLSILAYNDDQISKDDKNYNKIVFKRNDIAKFLIDNGAKNSIISNPISIAIRENNLEIVEYLCEKDKSLINHHHTKHFYPPIMIAIKNFNIFAALILIEHGANLGFIFQNKHFIDAVKAKINGESMINKIPETPEHQNYEIFPKRPEKNPFFTDEGYEKKYSEGQIFFEAFLKLKISVNKTVFDFVAKGLETQETWDKIIEALPPEVTLNSKKYCDPLKFTEKVHDSEEEYRSPPNSPSSRRGTYDFEKAEIIEPIKLSGESSEQTEVLDKDNIF